MISANSIFRIFAFLCLSALLLSVAPRNTVVANSSSTYVDTSYEISNDEEDIETQKETVTPETSLVVIDSSDWTDGWRPEGWVMHWQPPSADGFTGSATYSYSFEVPAGRRGLQPNVTLSYNSSALNGAIRKAPEGLVGAGWSINQISIVRTGVEQGEGGINFDDNDFRLILNGSGHKLIKDDSDLTSSYDHLLGGELFYAENAPN